MLLLSKLEAYVIDVILFIYLLYMLSYTAFYRQFIWVVCMYVLLYINVIKYVYMYDIQTSVFRLVLIILTADKVSW